MKKALSAALALAALAIPALAKNALILHDGREGKPGAYETARYIYNLLDHFGLDGKSIVRFSACAPGAVSRADFVFVVCEDDAESLGPALLGELAATPAQVIWLNMHLDDLIRRAPSKWGIRYLDFDERDDWRIAYKGVNFGKEDPGLNMYRVDDPRRVSTLASVRAGAGREYPYALHSGNLWYFADSPFSYAVEGGRFLIFADLLHDILGEDHTASRRALVRIEDVTPEDDPEALADVVSYLHGEGVPFAIAVVPIFKNPSEQIERTLETRPKLLAVLKDAVCKGGTIVLHGATHQNRGVSGDDYEFWDDVAGVPIPHESPDWVDQRVQLGLNECFRNGLYPLAWETPHYSGSQSDYRTFAKSFDAFYDRVMAAEISGTQEIFPYPATLKDLGVTVIPETLGYVDLAKPDPKALLAAAEHMKVVRDGVASFFFHPFVKLKHLKTLVGGLREAGWEFVSIRDFPCNVRTAGLWATSEGREVRVQAEGQFIHRLHVGRDGKVKKNAYSETRERGVVADSPAMAPGDFYVLEAVDSLPAAPESGWLARAFARAAAALARKPAGEPVKIPRALVLLKKTAPPAEDNDQKSFVSVLKIFGFNPETREDAPIRGLKLADYDLLVVPFATAGGLAEPEIGTLVSYVERGGALVIDGRTRLAERLGISFSGRTARITEAKDLTMPAQILKWNPPDRIQAPGASESLVLEKDNLSETAIVLLRSLGRGKALYLAALFDPYTVYGTSRFSYLPFHLKNALGLPFSVRRNNLEFYFDPGFHPSSNWEKLVARWKAAGVRIVYLAAWHFYKAYRFDYKYFIGLCHDHGIAVYAWFELPQVTPLFWDEHPEWREKNMNGEDSHSSWRLQMNLFNPAAREAARAFVRGLLREHPWDGVNLAELNFDTNVGAREPEIYTPMNADVRRAFRDSEGVDPVEFLRPASPHFWQKDAPLYAKFVRLRTTIIRDLHKAFLTDIETVRKEKDRDMEVIVTAIDTLSHPEIVERDGIDSRDILALMDEFPFVLQVEDPDRSWKDPPSRYLRFYEAYRPYLKDIRRLMFDVNCVTNREIIFTTLPTLLPTGTELATTLFYATAPSGRAAVYAESTVQPYDMDILSYVVGSDVAIRDRKGWYEIKAGAPFILNLDRQDRLPYLNGTKWPFFETRDISIPSGTNRLTFEKAGLLDVEALSLKMAFSGDITRLERTASGYRLTYASPIPVSLTYSRPLDRLAVDARAVEVRTDRSGLVLPRGEHELEIASGTASDRAVDAVGYVSSKIFYGAGLLAVSLLMGIYVSTRSRR